MIPKDTKLKNYQYHIKGIDSNKPALECLSAVILGMIVPIVIAVVIRIISDSLTA